MSYLTSNPLTVQFGSITMVLVVEGKSRWGVFVEVKSTTI